MAFQGADTVPCLRFTSTRSAFRQRMADLVARQRRAAYEGPGEDPAPPAKKPPAKEAATVKMRRKKA
jgi:hypothetical protein